MEINLRTLTPMWTGGVDGQSNRLQETGVIGSLRWWYEIIVRGMGGYVGDPTANNPDRRCRFDAEAYQKALRQGASREEAVPEGLKGLGAVEYLFGATGWARLFGLRALNAPRVPLHFRSALPVNKNWLRRLFGYEGADGDYTIEGRQAIHGDLAFQTTFRRYDVDYVQSQLALLFRFVERYGSLGAKPQHGFGQVTEVSLPDAMASVSIEDGLQALRDKLDQGVLRNGGPSEETPYDLTNFFHQEYRLFSNVVHRFTQPDAHIGSEDKQDETAYLPCAFDLRYKGSDEPHSNLGLRRWLRREKGWEESDDPNHLEKLDRLMGPRHKWEDDAGRTFYVKDKRRTASRIYFSMPFEAEDDYHVYVFGFAPSGVITVDDLSELCNEYMDDVLNAPPVGETTLGRDLIAPYAQGGAS
jgi:CRISPR-associated protein Cmr1